MSLDSDFSWFKISVHDRRTVSWWLSKYSDIDLDPPYQRKGHAWSTKQKQLFIDSIINEYDVPKFYFADFSYGFSPLNLARKKYAIIDGKQRFIAMKDFIDGRLSLSDDFKYISDPGVDIRGKSFNELLVIFPKAAEIFEQFNIDVMSVYTNDDSRINDLFIRLNSSSPLSAPELRSAMKGVVPGLIDSIANSDFFKKKIKFKTGRGEDKAVAAKLLLIEFRGRDVDTKKYQVDALVEEGVKAESRTGFKVAAGRVNSTLKFMSKIFYDSDPLLKNQGQITIYYQIAKRFSGMNPRDLRLILDSFEDARVNNSNLIKSGGVGDFDIGKYNALSRSVNDAGSIGARVEILSRFIERAS